MQRRPTSADVAARAGVSRTTVSFVLNGRGDAKIPAATRERVLAAAAELGYVPHASARQLAGGRSHTIALVLRQSADQVAGDAMLVETLRGLSAAARSAGLRVMVEALSPSDAESSYVSLVRGQHADGLVLSGPRTDDPAFLELVRDGFPVVLQGSLPDVPIPSVDVDNVAGARQAVEHLIELGHRRIAMITNAPVVYTAAVQRAEGYREALAAAGIPYDSGLVDEGGFDAPSGQRAMSAILRRRTFDAVFVASDVVALGAIGALRESGRRIPDDVSVVGFDDVPLAAFFDPPLTTVRLPAFELGHAAGVALIRRIADPSVVDRTLLPIELVVRAATKARNGA